MINMPFTGGVWDQDSDLLSVLSTAWQAWYIFGYMPKNKIKWGPDDRDFIAWVGGEDG